MEKLKSRQKVVRFKEERVTITFLPYDKGYRVRYVKTDLDKEVIDHFDQYFDGKDVANALLRYNYYLDREKENLLIETCDDLFENSEYYDTFVVEDSDVDAKAGTVTYFDDTGFYVKVNALTGDVTKSSTLVGTLDIVIPGSVLADILRLGSENFADRYDHNVTLNVHVVNFLTGIIQVCEDDDVRKLYLDLLEEKYDALTSGKPD